MKLSDVFFGILYGGAFILIIYFIMGLINKPSAPSTVVVYQDETPVYQESVIWPWYGPYNWYNTWSPWSYTGGGYYGRGYGGSHGPRWGSGQTRPYGGGGRGGNRGGFGGGRGGGMGGRGGGMGGRGGGGGGRR